MPEYQHFSTLQNSEVFTQLHTTPEGITTKEALSRQTQYGRNELESINHHWWPILRRQFASPFVWLLVSVSVISFFLGEPIDAAIVIIFIAINTLLGFFQEYRSEKTLSLLKGLTVHQVTVKRDNATMTVPVYDLVPGDYVFLSAGNLVPADIRFLQTESCLIDESILTGESISITKSANPGSSSENIGFSGTSLIQGKAEGIVLTISKATQFGKIASLATSTKRMSNFESDIQSYSRFILRLVVSTLVIIFVANMAIKGRGANPAELLLFSLTLAVSVIPEALPVVTTFSLSAGARKLAKSKVVVKRLSAIEDLGSIDVLCTDKTGTLTENKLEFKQIFAEDKDKALLFAALAGVSGSDPFDQSIASALSPQLKDQLRKYQIVRELPFDPTRRRNTLLVKTNLNSYLISRGAPESILGICSIGEKDQKNALSWITSVGKKGERVLAVAIKTLKAPLPTELLSTEKDMELLGVLSFSDPLKSTTLEAIHTAKHLGVQIKIATGDAPAVAHAVAIQTGLISETDPVITGEDFMNLSPQKQIAVAESHHVFARMTPAAKYHLIQLLSTTHRVGFLGEGVNDAPALKIAHVGLVVQSGSDIARESADIILLQKSLHVITSGIRHGREVATNTTKYLLATLSSNFGNFYAIAISSLFIPFLPMLPLQILLVNLLSDFPMITVATDNVDHADISHPHQHDIKNTILLASVLGAVSTVFDFITFGLFYRQGAPTLQTAWFIVSIVTELLFIFIIRSKRSVFKSNAPGKALIALTIPAIAITFILPYLEVGHQVFGFISLPATTLALVIGIIVINAICSEGAKLLYMKHIKS